jgi:hypothetical protein
MLYWLELGYKLNSIGRNTGVYVASRGQKHAVLSTNFFDEVERKSEWFTTAAAATAEAEAMVRERSGQLASV